MGTTLLLGAFKLQQASRLSADDNSNQSSIADSSPVKQENSCSTSPTPDPTAASHRERSEAKADQSPDSKRGEPLLNAVSAMVPSQSRPAGGIAAAAPHQMDCRRHFLFLSPQPVPASAFDKTTGRDRKLRWLLPEKKCSYVFRQGHPFVRDLGESAKCQEGRSVLGGEELFRKQSHSGTNTGPLDPFQRS